MSSREKMRKEQLSPTAGLGGQRKKMFQVKGVEQRVLLSCLCVSMRNKVCYLISFPLNLMMGEWTGRNSGLLPWYSFIMGKKSL